MRFGDRVRVKLNGEKRPVNYTVTLNLDTSVTDEDGAGRFLQEVIRSEADSTAVVVWQPPRGRVRRSK